jgi:hypothetical protein
MIPFKKKKNFFFATMMTDRLEIFRSVPPHRKHTTQSYSDKMDQQNSKKKIQNHFEKNEHIFFSKLL